MKLVSTRTRLLSGAALTVGLTMIAASPAQAGCVANAASYDCAVGQTTTNDGSGTGVTDRDGPFTTATVPIAVNIPAGATVDGFGIAATEIGVGVEDLTITNNGAVIVNVGNTPTAGGTGAADFSVTGATD